MQAKRWILVNNIKMLSGFGLFTSPSNLVFQQILKAPKTRHEPYFIAVLNAQIELKQDFNHIRKVNKTIERQENFIQEVIYNGRIGDYLKFIYREFSDNMVRPAFTQEVQYDLAASHIIGFKSLRLEVIEASNTEITYKLISNF